MTDVYTTLRTALKTYDANIDVTGVFPMSTEKLPCVYIQEIGKYQNVRFSTLTNDDNQYHSTYEIQVFVGGDKKMTKATEIFEVALQSIKGCGYRLDSWTHIPDDKIYRITGRFHRVIGGGD